MRRKDREIIDMAGIEEIIEKADACRIALSDNNIPYIVAMNYGYVKAAGGKPAVLYFHCANEGRKLDIIRKNSLVCFQMDTGHELVRSGTACGWGMKYSSVVGMGKAVIIRDGDEKIAGLNAVMKHYTGKDSVEYGEKDLNLTTVIKLEITEIKGKKKDK